VSPRWRDYPDFPGTNLVPTGGHTQTCSGNKSGVDSMGRLSQTCSRNKYGVDSMGDVPQICSGNKFGGDSMENTSKVVPGTTQVSTYYPKLFREQLWCRLNGRRTQSCSRNNSSINSIEDVPTLVPSPTFVPGQFYFRKQKSYVLSKCIVSLSTEYIYVCLQSLEGNKTR
jgi:hypothetical protein